MKRKIYKSKYFLPILVSLIIIALFCVNAYHFYRLPEVFSITPEVSFPGEYIEITGNHFGKSRAGSEVRIAGKRPLSTSYRMWSDNKIVVKVPDDSSSGMVTVNTRKGISNGLLFTNKEHIPIILKGPQKPGYPHIENLQPESGNVGELLRIKGLNFGNDRGDSSVFFTSYAFEDKSTPENSIEGMIECSEIDYDYNSWGEQEITVFIPDGATSGNIRVLTDRGVSNAIYFEVIGGAGKKNFGDKLGIQLEYGVDISNVIGDPINSLNLWLPMVAVTLEQRNVETISEPEPLWKDYLGLMRFNLSNITSEKTKIVVNSWLECYEINTSVNQAKVLNIYNEERMLYKVYTASEDLIPADNEIIINSAKQAIGYERNPYLKAKAIYEYLINTLVYSSRPVAGQDVLENFGRKQGDSFTYSILFSAMCRAVGIPARPIAGVLIYDNKQSESHYWADFYLEGFGWIPTDPALGDGVRFGNLPDTKEDSPQEFYFGSLDSHHIAFTKGVVPVKKIEQVGKIAGKKANYSLQTISEESVGLDKYTSYWRPVSVVNWW